MLNVGWVIVIFFSISFLFSQFHGPPEKRVYELYMGLLMSDRFTNIRHVHILLTRFLSRPANRTPNFTNREFQFSQFKVLQSVFSF